MRAIYHNWKNVPQNILPKSMMPEGITPSDRILLLLARLSRAEEDPQKATALLEREIEHRNAQSPEARRDLTLTSADIDKVLASFGDESGSQYAAEMSSTPQPFSQHVWQSTSDSGHSDVLRRLKRDTISANESVSHTILQNTAIAKIILYILRSYQDQSPLGECSRQARLKK
jgi:hypothetical protein